MKEINLTNSEWYVMECLWEQSPKSLMQLVQECGEHVGWAKSPTTTMVKRMGEKGLIRYEETGRTKQFYPTVKREDVVVRQTRDFLQRIYHGSVGMMMNALVQNDDLSEADIEELESILKQCKKSEPQKSKSGK